MTALMNPGASQALASCINFATDGVPNEGGGQAGGVTARNAAIAAGIDNISVEGIGGGVNVGYLTGSICYPQPYTTAPTFNFPAQGFYIGIAGELPAPTTMPQQLGKRSLSSRRLPNPPRSPFPAALCWALA
jgi:hypothetical protein